MPTPPHEHRFEAAELTVVNPYTGVRYQILGQRCSCGATLASLLIANERRHYVGRRKINPFHHLPPPIDNQRY